MLKENLTVIRQNRNKPQNLDSMRLTFNCLKQHYFNILITDITSITSVLIILFLQTHSYTSILDVYFVYFFSY